MAAKTIPFIKMEGAGNDFVFLDRATTNVPVTPTLARRLLDRHFGVGGDQLLVLDTVRKGKIPNLAIYNSDGSQAEMCGNGVRAVAYYLNRFRGFRSDFTLLTKRGRIGIGLRNGAIDVNMGAPILDGTKIPVKARGEVVNRSLPVSGKTFRIHAVSMGNPHCVIFVPKLNHDEVTKYGPLIEHHPFFPNRVNVEFVEVLNRGHVRARVWERGAGETLACGTGACAIAVAGIRAGKLDRQVKIDLPGGQLRVRWPEGGDVFLSGPANVAYTGEFLLS